MVVIKPGAKKRRSCSGASIAEFGAAFYAFCIAILIPTINFLTFAVAFSYSFVSANVIADTTAQAFSTKRAQAVLNESIESLKSDPLAKFLNVSATDDFKLEVVTTNMRGDTEVARPGTRYLSDEDQSNKLYQYRVTASYSLRPLLNLSSVPLINEIPIIGKPTVLSFKNFRSLEHTEGLTI